MGLTENHWFEDEEPELTERQLEDYISTQDGFYRRGYNKGYSDGVKEQEEKMKHLNNITLEYEKEVFRLQTLLKEQEAVVRCKDCARYEQETGRCKNKVVHGNAETWFCADGERREYVKPPTESATDWEGVECE